MSCLVNVRLGVREWLAGLGVKLGTMFVPASGAVLAARYRLEAWIAAGGMGEVWRALDLVLGRPVAVKLLRSDDGDHAEALARFRAEARHAAALSHPAIAQVYDYGEAAAGLPPYLVLELVDGQPLTQLLASGPLEPWQVLDLVAQVASGLSAAHAAGLVHRDIKPGNLLIDRSGAVKITDFGIAYAAGSVPLTRTGTLIGTPAYLSPERLAGSSAGPASDLYSLGIVAYECLAGSLPFAGTPIEVALAHRRGGLPPLPAAVPRPLAALISELTRRDPGRRPASAAEVAARAANARDTVAGAAASKREHWRGALATRPAIAALAVLAALAGWAHEALATITAAASGLAQASGVGEVRLARRLPWPARRSAADWRQRAPVLAGAGLAMAGLLVVLLAGTDGPTAARGRTEASASPTISAAMSRLVDVRGGDLAGRPVTLVARLLGGRGLDVRVRWSASDRRAPGMVLWVRPAGWVPAGATVVVTGAIQPGRRLVVRPGLRAAADSGPSRGGSRPPRPGRPGGDGGPGHGHGHGHGHGKGDGHGGHGGGD